MEIAQAIKDAETALRDFLQASFEKRFGPDWAESDLFSQERVDSWKERKEEIEENLPAESSEESLFYHVPFGELSGIVAKYWDSGFHTAFGELSTFQTYLKILELYRDPDIHRRTLFIHQKHLALGVSGEISARISAYRSMEEAGKEGFPRIEYIKDNFGNLWVPGKPRRVKTQSTLNPGSRLEFIVQARDPEDMPLEYKIHSEKWQSGNILIFDIKEKHVQKTAQFSIAIKSSRKHHAFPNGYDDRIVFEYQIVPEGN